jgi:uncharacterized protein YbjT (DUF2867 family)
MTIIFIGASGMLGKPVAKELIDAGHDLVLLARDPAKMEKLFPGVRVVKADVFNQQSLLDNFHNADIVYLNLSVHPNSKEKDPQPEREGIQNIISAAKEKNVRRIACLSSLVKNYEGMNSFHWWSFQIKQQAIENIRKSGLHYSIFYPSTFMETLNHQMMKGDKIFLLGKSVAPMWFIAAEDYARQVKRSFETAGSENKEYNIQGPEAFTFDQAAKIFIENYSKKKIRSMKVPMWPLRFFGKFNQQINYGVNICEALNNYPEEFVSEDSWRELGRPLLTLQQWAASR